MSARLRKLFLYFLVFLIVIWTIAPFVWLIISSFSYKVDLLSVPLKWIPSRVTIENYQQLFMHEGNFNVNAALFSKSTMNSMIIAFTTTFLAMFLGVLAAYALARVKFPGSNVYMGTMMGAQMIPPIAIVIPLYVILRQLNIYDTHFGLILVYLSFVLPLVIWLMRSYFASIPAELEDAARIDGCTRLQALVKIVLPLSAPGLVSVFLFAFIASWNEYLYAFIYTNVNAKTLPVLIGEFSTKLGLEYLRIAAAGVIASLPPIILALLFSRYLVKGLTAGSVKA
jgi:multiple sugar transport system permease protein